MADAPSNLATKQNGPPSGIMANDKGLQLTSMESMWWFANRVCESGLAPKGMDRPAAAFIAIQMGAELGLTPMSSLQNIAVINGRPSVWGDAMLAICINSGNFDASVFKEVITGQGDAMTATCTVKRKDSQAAVERTFSAADAKVAGLWGKQGPWTQYPKRMLQMRARSFALRDAFADRLRGFLEHEEAREIVATVIPSDSSEVPIGGVDRLTARLGVSAPKPELIEAAEPAKVAEPPAEVENEMPPIMRLSIMLDDLYGCGLEAAQERLERFAHTLYRKPFASMTAKGLEAIEGKIKSGEIKVEAKEPEPATT